MTSLPALAKRFRSFADLAASYREGVDYRIQLQVGSHPHIAVVAPHGGRIEHATSHIASAISGSDFSCYLFEGIRTFRNYDALHLTSEKFDEPRCLELIEGCDYVVTVHGCKGSCVEVLLGGRERNLAVLIANSLTAVGIQAKLDGHDFKGLTRTNICNRGKNGAGVQLELTEALRKSPQDMAGVVQAVREVLLRCSAGQVLNAGESGL